MSQLDNTEQVVKLLQTAIGIIGTLVSVAATLSKPVGRWLALRSESQRHSLPPVSAEVARAEDAAKEAIRLPPVQMLVARFGERHSTLELAFASLFAAIFSVVFSDALLDERVAAASPLRAFLHVAALTAFVALLLFAAWFQRQLEFVVGTLSVTAMLVLLLSTRSALLDARTDIDSGSLLLVPLLCLLTAASGAISFLFGNPFGRGVSRKHMFLWGIGVLVVMGLAAGVVGRQKVRALEADSRSPQVRGAQVDEIVKKVAKLPADQQRAFYQLASDLALAPEYRNEHAITESKLRADHEVLIRLTSEQEILSAAPGAAKVDSAQAAPELIARPLAVKATDPTLNLVSKSDNQLDDLRRSELRRSLLNTALERFRALTPDSRSEYVLTRLTWIHPLGVRPGELRAATPLPGTTARSRYAEAAILRVNHALAAEDLEAPKGLRSHFSPFSFLSGRLPAPEPPAPDASAEIRGAFEYDSSINPLRQNQLFSQLPKDGSLVYLRTQLTWPREAEAWAAYEEYKDIAYSRFGADQRALFERYDALSDSERNAFREQIATSKYRDERLVALERIAASGIDVTAITDAQNVMDLQLISKKLQEPAAAIAFLDARGGRLVERLLQPQSLNVDERQTLAQLLEESGAQKLFSAPTLAFVSKVVAVGKELRPKIFPVLSDPIENGILSVAAKRGASVKGEASTQSPLYTRLEEFASCGADERESILLRFAKDLYGAGGRNAFLPHQQLIYTAGEVSRGFAIAVAGLLTLPFFLLAVFAGTFVARRLRAHHRHRALLGREAAEHMKAVSAENVGKAGPVRGRDEFLKLLVGLGSRGWTTTAVAGRRGVGKSRALQELMKLSGAERSESRVAVWVSAPTEFDEKEFVLTMLERLADSVETTIAHFLGAEPFSVRRAEARIAGLAVAMFTLGSAFAWWLVQAVQPDSDAVTIAVSVLPSVTLLLSGGLLLVLHVVRLQPVNLEPWLERDRTQQVATALLYRDARRVRAATSSFRATSRWATVGASLGWAALWAALGAIGLSAVALVTDEDSFAFAAFSIFVGALVWRVVMSDRYILASADRGYMSLIATYRSFAETVVRRLREGALGNPASASSRAGRVIVAIDELDKMPAGDIKTFVRRIKAVFEVPGVYYYVSISEDALLRLYLGVSDGKDEFDSSFDHIVQLQPLHATQAAAAATDFLNATSVSSNDPRLPAMIGAASLGVPRDVLRRVDEIRGGGSVDSLAFGRYVRRRMAELGYRADLVSRDQMALLASSAAELDRQIEAILAEHAVALAGSKRLDSVLRFWISCWVIAALEMAVVDEVSEQSWLDRAEALRDLGYRVTLDPPTDLVKDVTLMRSGLATSETRISKAAAVPPPNDARAADFSD